MSENDPVFDRIRMILMEKFNVAPHIIDYDTHWTLKRFLNTWKKNLVTDLPAYIYKTNRPSKTSSTFSTEKNS